MMDAPSTLIYLYSHDNCMVISERRSCNVNRVQFCVFIFDTVSVTVKTAIVHVTAPTSVLVYFPGYLTELKVTLRHGTEGNIAEVFSYHSATWNCADPS